MGVLRLSVCLVLLCLVPGGFTQEAVHVVRRGDTLYSLARQYGVPVQEILDLNGIADASRIREGQRLRMPPARNGQGGTAAAGQGELRSIEYRAVRGDSLYALARRYGTTMEAILQASGLAADHVLKAGDRLRIPQGAAPPPAAGNRNAPGGTVPGTQAPPRAADIPPAWPVRAREVSPMSGGNGVVLLGERSEPVRSLTQGTVISAGPYRGFGRVAVVQVTGGYFYVYGGCESLAVKEGDRVAPGTELGRLGLDGVSSKPQLFFMVYRNNSPVDPAGAPRS